MRPMICLKRCCVKRLSASWRRKYRACRMRRPPVLNSRCWRLVSDQLCQAAIDGLSEQARQRELAVTSRAGIGEVSLDQGAQAEPLVQLARQQQPGVGGHRRATELDAELGAATASAKRAEAWGWVMSG